MNKMVAGVLTLVGLCASAHDNAPALDKQKIEQFLRFAEGYAPSVKFAIDDPEPTSVAGYYRLRVHLSAADTKMDKVYYVSSDGKRVSAAPVWDVNENPFADAIRTLPSHGPSFGPPNAKVKLIVFSDFECPYCREFARTMRDNLTKKYPNDVQVVFEDFPLESIHPWAKEAAEAGDCVADQSTDSFWTFHDWIFEHQGEISTKNVREKVLAFAQTQKLDVPKLTSCLETHKFRAQVEESIKVGKDLGIQQTPTFYLNGRQVPGALPWSSLDTLIQMELNRPAFIPAVSGK